VVGFEDVSRYKPDPEPINLVLSRLAIQPRETLMVGDSVADIESARTAGCWSCYATWGLPSVLQTSDTIQADLTTEAPEAILEFNL
jgi:phosphoglycolate phosphatase-like HAD superfamily hydrolase